MISPRLVILSVPALVLAGCASVDPKGSFDAVQGAVQSRTGQLIQWDRGTPEDRQADKAVCDLLCRPLTADGAVQVALLNNPSLQAAFEQIGISQADFVQAGLLRNPSFSALIRFPNVPPLGADQEFSVAGDFFQLFLLPIRKKMAALQLEETELQVGDKVLSLAAEVKRAFYGVQADEQLVQRLELINDIDKTAAELAQKQHEAGNVNDLDLENQRTIYTASQAHVAQARIDILHDREALNRLLGWTEALPRWTVAGQLPAIQADPLPASALERRALVQRLDIAAARKRIEAFRKSLGVTEASRFFPGGVNIGVDTEENPDRSRVTGPSIDVEVPIFDQGQAKVATAQAQLRQAQNRLKTLVVNARSDIRESRAVLEACRSLAETYRKTLLPERVRILQLSQELYNYMLQGSYDLLLAKQQEIEAERDTWRNYWVTRADLEKAVGGFLPVATADAKH